VAGVGVMLKIAAMLRRGCAITQIDNRIATLARIIFHFFMFLSFLN
jgi:hypothetical protein